MSTTFWLSSSISKPGLKDCATGDDRYGLEVDIQETIGVPNLVHTPDFHAEIGSNTHYWYTIKTDQMACRLFVENIHE